MKIRITNSRIALPAWLLAGAVAMLIAGCGGGNSASSSTSGGSSAAVSSTTNTSSSSGSSGIPQGNVGDNDSDNHGAPSDGDGNL